MQGKLEGSKQMAVPNLTWQVWEHSIFGLNCSGFYQESLLQSSLHLVKLTVASVDVAGGVILLAHHLDDVGLSRVDRRHQLPHQLIARDILRLT